MIAGFDPRYQFIHADDVVRALEFAVEHDLPGIYNVAPDGVLALSEVIGLLGKQRAAGAAAVGHRRWPPRCCAGLGFRLPPEMLLQLRYGRGLDNRRLKAAGFALPLHDPRDRAGVRRAPAPASVLKGVQEPYRYEKEVEDFLRWSPSVREREARVRRAPAQVLPVRAGAGSPTQPAQRRAADGCARRRSGCLGAAARWSKLGPSFAGVLMGRSNL